MASTSIQGLARKRCTPCEGGVPALEAAEVEELLKSLPARQTVGDGQRIRREWKAKNFMAAIAFFDKIAELAEAEEHHPDLHLEGYRNVAIEIWTHAIGGLSENDFILAAKIEGLPFDAK